MHTLLVLSNLLLVLLAGSTALGTLRRRRGHPRRRGLQFLVLGSPVVGLALGVGGLYHFAGRACLREAPAWDQALAVAIPAGMALIAVGAAGLGVVRLALLDRVVERRGHAAGPAVQRLADGLADGLGVSRPRVRLCVYDRPLALTCGLRRPTLLLSTWLIDHLDDRELESVLAHELAHAARRDYLAIGLATVLRDAFFYLPTSWAAYRQLQREKEPACDDLAVGATRRPLALASALAKVWQQALDERSVPSLGQALTGAGESVEGRIERLLAQPERPVARRCPRRRAWLVGSATVAGLLAIEAVSLIVMLAPLGCSPVAVPGGFA